MHRLNKERSAAWTSERLQVYFSALVLSTRQAWNEGQREELHDVSSGACQAFCQGHRALRRGISAAKKKTAEVTSDYTGAMLCSVHHAPRYVAPHPSLRLGTPPKMPCDCDRLCLGMQGLFSRKTLQRVQQPKLRRRPGPVVTRRLVWEALEMSFLQRGWQGEAKASVLHGQGRFLRSLQFICALCHETGKANHDHVFPRLQVAAEKFASVQIRASVPDAAAKASGAQGIRVSWYLFLSACLAGGCASRPDGERSSGMNLLRQKRLKAKDAGRVGGLVTSSMRGSLVSGRSMAIHKPRQKHPDQGRSSSLGSMPSACWDMFSLVPRISGYNYSRQGDPPLLGCERPDKARAAASPSLKQVLARHHPQGLHCKWRGHGWDCSMKQEEISTASTVSIWRPLLGSPGQGVSTACHRDVFDLPACKDRIIGRDGPCTGTDRDGRLSV